MLKIYASLPASRAGVPAAPSPVMKRKHDSEEASVDACSPYKSNKCKAEPSAWPFDVHGLQTYELQLQQAACLQRPRIPGKPGHRLAPLKQPWEAALKLASIMQQRLQQQEQTQQQKCLQLAESHMQLQPTALISAANISTACANTAASPEAAIQVQQQSGLQSPIASVGITAEIEESTITDSSGDVADCAGGTIGVLLDDADSVSVDVTAAAPLSCNHTIAAPAACIVCSCSQHNQRTQRPTLSGAAIDVCGADTTQGLLASTRAMECDASRNGNSCGFGGDAHCSSSDVTNTSDGSCSCSSSSEGSRNSSDATSENAGEEDADNTTCASVHIVQQQQVQQAVSFNPNTTAEDTSSVKSTHCEPAVLQSSVQASMMCVQELQQQQSQWTPSPPPAAALAVPKGTQHSQHHSGGKQQQLQKEQLLETPVLPEQQRAGARTAHTPADCQNPSTPQLACLLATATADQHPSHTTTAMAAGSHDAVHDSTTVAEAQQQLAAANSGSCVVLERSPIVQKYLQQSGGAGTPAEQVRPQNWLLLTPVHSHSSSKLRSAAALQHDGDVAATNTSTEQHVSQYRAAAVAPHTPEVTPVVPASAQQQHQQQPLPGPAQHTSPRRILGSVSQRRAALLMSPIAAMKPLPPAPTGSSCSSSGAAIEGSSNVVKGISGKDDTEVANLFDSWLQLVNSSNSTISRRGLLPPPGPTQSALKKQRQLHHRQQLQAQLASGNLAASGQQMVNVQQSGEHTAQQPQPQQQRPSDVNIAGVDLNSDAIQPAAGRVQQDCSGSKPSMKRQQCDSSVVHKNEQQPPSGALLTTVGDDTSQHRDTKHSLKCGALLNSMALQRQQQQPQQQPLLRQQQQQHEHCWAISSLHRDIHCSKSDMSAAVEAIAATGGDSSTAGPSSALLGALSTINSSDGTSCDSSPVAGISVTAMQQPALATTMSSAAVASAASLMLPHPDNNKIGRGGPTSSSNTIIGTAAAQQAEMQQVPQQQQHCEQQPDAAVLKVQTNAHVAAQHSSGSAAETCAGGFVPCGIPASALLGVTRRMAYVRIPRTAAHGRTAGTAKQARLAAAAGSSGNVRGTPARSDGAGNAPTSETLEQRLREAYLDMQLAAAAVDGALWADLDLAGLPRSSHQERLHEYKEMYSEAKSRLLRNRPFTEVSRLEHELTTEWQWLQRVRHMAAQAASSCAKQSILRRSAPPVELPGWQVDARCSSVAATACAVKQRPRVHFQV